MISDLISLIEKEKDVTNVIILTHNIDFVFFQLVVLPALKRCGQPSITIFADAHCAADTFAYQSKVVSGLGTRFRVIPILLEPGFCFHPKAILMSASNRATLFVGSGNLTFGGWRENAEVWIRFDSDTDGTGPFAAFNDYLRKILERVPLNNSVKAEIEESFDRNSHGWAEKLDEPAMLVGKVAEGEALLSQTLRFLGGGPVDRFTCCSPYFDSEGDALQEILSGVQPVESQVLVQRGRSTFSRRIESRLSLTKVAPVDFSRTSDTNSGPPPFLHAKFYAFQRGDEVTVFAGSANCSRAALTIPGHSGNAELLAIQQLNRADFEELYLNHLEFLDVALELPEDLPEKEETPGEPAGIHILGARLEGQELRVAFKCSHDAQLTGCQLDERPTEFQLISDRMASVKTHGAPRTVVLEALSSDHPLRSNLMWIDIEKELRSTSRGRAVSEAIRRNVRTGVWSLGAWTEILEVFYKNLHYIPSRARTFSIVGTEGGAEKLLQFTEEDVFSDTYTTPVIRSIGAFGSREERLRSLRQMFLQWFGESVYESDEPEPAPTEGDEQGDGNGADGDPVDVAVKIPSPGTRTQEPRHPPAKNETEKDRKKAKQIVEQVIQAMTARRDYLEQRPPEHFAADIKISAVLLRTALHEGWISKSDFIDCTQRIWTPLFITSEIDRQFGWVEHRYRSSKSPADFASSMISSELSATLLMWALAPPAGSTQGYIDNARFVFGSILSVARLPWLWQGNDDASTAEQLSKLLHHTGTEVQDSSSLANLQTSWQLLKRRGQALRALEQALDGHTPGELREAIVQEEIKEGELLWQGTGGFCVAAQKFSRSKEKEKALTVRLHGKLEEVKVLSGYTIPVRALLDEAIIPVTDGFGAKQRDEIARLVEELMERSTNQESGG